MAPGTGGATRKVFAHTPDENVEGRPIIGGEFNSTNLLSRGWTRTAIKKLLGAPDRRRPTVHRWRTRLETLYSIDRVLKAEATPEFKKVRERSDYESRLSYYGPGIRVASRDLLLSKPPDLMAHELGVLKLLLVNGRTERSVAKALKITQQAVSLIKRKLLSRPEFKTFFRNPGRWENPEKSARGLY